MRSVALALAIGALAASSAGASTLPPRLALVQRQPLVLAGSHFRPAERVTVTVSGIRWRTVAVRGAFRLTLRGLWLSRCEGLSIVAVGSLGSRVALKIPQPACMPAQSP